MPLPVAVPAAGASSGPSAAQERPLPGGASHGVDLFAAPHDLPFAHITDLVMLALKVPLAAIYLAEADRQVFRASRPLEPSDRVRAAAFAAAVTDAGTAQSVADLSALAGPGLPAGASVRAVAGAPLRLEDNARIGALVAIADAARSFDADDLAMLRNLAACMVNELELRRRAAQDSLTGVQARGAFMARLKGLFDAHRASGQPAALSILDLDHFKSVNDRYGHDAGDAVLMAVAATCARVLPADALVGRLGGEEFAIALPDCSEPTALAVLGRLRDAIAALHVPAATGLRVTASFGVASIAPAVANPSVWCKLADAALYGAKEAGRNRIMVCSNGQAGPTLHTVKPPPHRANDDGAQVRSA